MASPDDEDDLKNAYGGNPAAWAALQKSQPGWIQGSEFSGSDPGLAFGPNIGGEPGGASQLASSLSQYGASAQGRQAPNLYTLGNIAGDVGQANAARAHQLQGLQALQNNNIASPSQIQMGSQLAGNLGGAFAQMRNGGRTGSNAVMPGITNAGGQAIAQGGAGVNQEANANNSAIVGATTNLGGADLNEQKQNQAFALVNAQLANQQGTINDKQQLAYEQMAQQTLNQQLQADTDYQLGEMGDAGQVSVQQINQNAALQGQVMGAGLGMAGGGLGSALSQLGSQDSYGSGNGQQSNNGNEGGDYAEEDDGEGGAED